MIDTDLVEDSFVRSQDVFQDNNFVLQEIAIDSEEIRERQFPTLRRFTSPEVYSKTPLLQSQSSLGFLNGFHCYVIQRPFL